MSFYFFLRRKAKKYFDLCEGEWTRYLERHNRDLTAELNKLKADYRWVCDCNSQMVIEAEENKKAIRKFALESALKSAEQNGSRPG